MTFEKTIIITGGAGFIGSNYLNQIVPRYPNYLFLNLDALTTAADLTNVEVDQAPNYLFIKADIRNLQEIEKIFQEHSPTDLIHFAAESHVDVSIENPNLFIETNINGTHNLLLLAKKFGLNRFQQISTDEIYGALSTTAPAFNEHSPLAPNNPYSASKASAELLARAYHKTFNLDIVISRCSNNYGPRQDTTKLIPLFITRLLNSESVPLYGQGQNVRDWIYVDDHVTAIDLIFHQGRAGEIYNVGGRCELTNLELTKRLLILTGRDESAINYVTDRLGHDFRYAIDDTKIRTELGWQPKIEFEEGLKRTFNFYQQKIS